MRRKADPAKGLVKDWVSKWRDDRAVRGSVSHDQVSGINLSVEISHTGLLCLHADLR